MPPVGGKGGRQEEKDDSHVLPLRNSSFRSKDGRADNLQPDALEAFNS